MYFRGKGAVLLSLEGRIAFASTYFCDLVGVEHKEIAGMSCFDFVFPEDRDKALELVNLEAESTPAPFRFRLRRMNGTEIWVDIQHAPMKAANGNICGITATVTAAGTGFA